LYKYFKTCIVNVLKVIFFFLWTFYHWQGYATKCSNGLFTFMDS